MHTSLRRILVRSIAPLFYIALIVFLIIYVQRLDWSRLEGLTISWWYIALATIFGLAFRYWAAYVWTTLLRLLGAAASYSPALIYVYAKSWLGRYIPGPAWVVGKMYFAAKLGISKNKLAVSSLLEGILQIVVTLAASFALLLLDARTSSVITSQLQALIVVALVGCMVFLLPVVFNRSIGLLYRLVKKKTFPTEHQATGRSILTGTWLYIIGSFLAGLSFFFIAKAVYAPLEYSDLIFVLAASNLASAVSMLALFAPSGIGVREGIQVALLAIIMPVEIALVIAVFTRIWSIVIDFLFYGAARLYQGSTDTH